MLSFTYAFAQWVRTKPADATYEYADAHNCAMCQFLRETGRAKSPRVAAHVGPYGGYWQDGAGNVKHPYPAKLEPALAGSGTVFKMSRETFGALASRLDSMNTGVGL